MNNEELKEEIDFGKIDRQNDWKDVEYIGGMSIGSDKAKGDIYMAFKEKDNDGEEEDAEAFLLRMQDEDFEKFKNMTASFRQNMER